MSHVDEGTLHALVDNELDADERAVVEAHLAACGDCARQFAEATALARQVVTLLSALDAPAAPVTVRTLPAVVHTPAPVPTPVLPTPVVPIRTRMVTLRRVALAASVLLVAGVSYQVGQRDAQAPASAVFEAARRQPARAAAGRAEPSVVDGGEQSYVAQPTPSVRAAPRGGPRDTEAELAAADPKRAPREESAIASAAAAPPRLVAPVVAAVPIPTSSQNAQKAISSQAGARDVGQSVAQGASAQADVSSRTASSDRADQAESRRARASESVSQDRAATVAQPAAPAARAAQSSAALERDASAPVLAAPKIIPLAGYLAVEDASVPAMTRRRYVSPSGLSLELSIVRSFVPTKDSLVAGASAEFMVSTANGRSTVRWHARGMDYVLHGPLAPDSLVKLATQLKP